MTRGCFSWLKLTLSLSASHPESLWSPLSGWEECTGVPVSGVEKCLLQYKQGWCMFRMILCSRNHWIQIPAQMKPRTSQKNNQIVMKPINTHLAQHLWFHFRPNGILVEPTSPPSLFHLTQLSFPPCLWKPCGNSCFSQRPSALAAGWQVMPAQQSAALPE